jgi:hypothetical protein
MTENIEEITNGIKNIKIKSGNNDLLSLLDKLLLTNNINQIAEKLNITSSTIKRWKELKDIPKNYEFDLLKMLGIKINYSLYDFKLKDQFYTSPDDAKKCFDIFCEEIKKYNDDEKEYLFIEPSAGDGSFLNILPKERTIAIDIEPRHENIITDDYLEWKPNTEIANKSIAVIGNPPFGLRGHMALRFINHSYDFADYVCFILPQLFESDGKGVPRKRVVGYNLIYSEKFGSNYHIPSINNKLTETNNNSLKIIKVNTIMQIWSKYNENEKYQIEENKNNDVKIYSLSDGGTSSSTRNKNMLDKCDIYIPSTCFGEENMKLYNSFEELPNRKGYGIVFLSKKEEYIAKSKSIKWNEVAFLSTNSAYNIRSSQIQKKISQI